MARVAVRFVVASSLVVFGSWGRPGLAQTDPMWRSPWSVSIGGGVIVERAEGGRCYVPEGEAATGCPYGQSYTVWSSGGTLDLSVLFAAWRSAEGHWALELGPQAAFDVWTPGGGLILTDAETYRYMAPASATFGPAVAVRVRPHAPPTPATHKGSFESALRLAIGIGPGFYGLLTRGSLELWGGWSMPRRWQPPLQPWQHSRPERRRAFVVGPYVRGVLCGYPVQTTIASAQIDLGIRVDIRRETAMPQLVP